MAVKCMDKRGILKVKGVKIKLIIYYILIYDLLLLLFSNVIKKINIR